MQARIRLTERCLLQECGKSVGILVIKVPSFLLLDVTLDALLYTSWKRASAELSHFNHRDFFPLVILQYAHRLHLNSHHYFSFSSIQTIQASLDMGKQLSWMRVFPEKVNTKSAKRAGLLRDNSTELKFVLWNGYVSNYLFLFLNPLLKYVSNIENKPKVPWPS